MPHEEARLERGHAEMLFVDASVRITRHTLPPGATTGVHTHECDYVVIPVQGGTVRIERGTESSDFVMTAGEAYKRGPGATHALANVSESVIVFVEFEYLEALTWIQ